MKKLFLSGLMILSMAISAFALDVELDVNYYNMVNSKITVVDRLTVTDLSQNSPAGIEINGVYYFAAPAKIMDIGVGVNLGLDSFNYISQLETSIPVATGRNIFLGIGPVFRFNLNSNNSIYLCPQYMFAKQNIVFNVNQKIDTTYSEFTFDVGYRGWFIHNTTFDMGIDTGFMIGVPLSGTSTVTSYSGTGDGKVKGDKQGKIYLGVCFNFGQKSSSNRAKFNKL